MKRSVGRPKTEVDPTKLCTVDQAVERMRAELFEKYKDEVIVDRMSYAKATIYKLISQKRIERYGSRRCALVNIDELFELCS